MLATPLASLVLLAPQATVLEGDLTLDFHARVEVTLGVDDAFADVAVGPDGTAYAVGTSGESITGLTAAAVAAGTSTPLWTASVEAPGELDARGTAVVVAGGVVVVAGQIDYPLGEANGLLTGRDPATGQVLWTTELGTAPASFPNLPARMEVTELVVAPSGGVVYARLRTDFLSTPSGQDPLGDRLAAIDPTDGSVLWQVILPLLNESADLEVTADGSALAVVGTYFDVDIFGNLDTFAVATFRSTADGSELWRSDASNGTGSLAGLSDAALDPVTGRLVAVGTWAQTQDVVVFSPSNGAVALQAGFAGLGLQSVVVSDAGTIVAAGPGTDGTSLLALDPVQQTIVWQQPGTHPEESVLDLDLDAQNGRVLVAYGSLVGLATAWHVEARSLADGSLVWAAQADPGSEPSRVAALAVDAGSGRVWSAGRTAAGVNDDDATLRAYVLADGSLAADVDQGATVPGEQLVSGLVLSPDGGVAYTAGLRGVRDLLNTFDALGSYVVAQDAATGSELWKRELAHLLPAGPLEAIALETLALGPDPGTLLLLAQRSVLCLDDIDGSVRWESPDLGLLASLAVAPGPGTVLAGSPGGSTTTLTALDPATGAVLWTHQETDGTFNAPTIVRVSSTGATAFLVSSVGGVAANKDLRATALDVATGAVLWSVVHDTNGVPETFDGERPTDARLASDDAVLLVYGRVNSAATSNAGMVALYRIDTATGALLGHTEAAPAVPSALQPRRMALSPDGSRAYTLSSTFGDIAQGEFDLNVHAFDAQTGQELWNTSWFTGLVLFENGHDLAVTRDGSTVVVVAGTTGSTTLSDALTLGLDADTGDVLWSVTLEGVGDYLEAARRAQLTPDARRLLVANVNGLTTTNLDLVLSGYTLPLLTAAPPSLSLAQGGVHRFDLSAGTAAAGDLALLVGSASGTAPGFPLTPDVTLPLVVDAYTTALLAAPGGSPLAGALATLDTLGHAEATLTVPAGASPALAGVTLYHAYVRLDLPSAVIVEASQPVALVLEP